MLLRRFSNGNSNCIQNWGDDKEFLNSGSVTLKSVLCQDGWMAPDFRKKLHKQYDEILADDYRHLIIGRETRYVMPNQPIGVKLEKFKAITIVMKYQPDTSKT